jgi:hypothetical protein
VGLRSFGHAETAIQAMQILASAADLMHGSGLGPQTFFCAEAGGRIDVSASDVDRDARLSSGDRVMVAYTNCGGNDSPRGHFRRRPRSTKRAACTPISGCPSVKFARTLPLFISPMEVRPR